MLKQNKSQINLIKYCTQKYDQIQPDTLNNYIMPKNNTIFKGMLFLHK